MRYSENIDHLVAAVSYLASHSYYWARTPANMAKELSLDRDRLREVFDAFPGIFRKSARPAAKSAEGEHFYSLQARYALREGGGTEEPEQVSYIAPLDTERLRLLIDFIKDQAGRETQLASIEASTRNAQRSAYVAAVAAGIAALLSLVDLIQG